MRYRVYCAGGIVAVRRGALQRKAVREGLRGPRLSPGSLPLPHRLHLLLRRIEGDEKRGAKVINVAGCCSLHPSQKTGSWC
ncbi:hypothetical protein SKAU_G00096270 [Synaphobranchus kaupii]|uniref:Uncharacterized protein n=1 Tax=Synaphobranchus kaupii TaxID=118154 RepID=A0A9Q1FY95_SYNKA|nr:hypothetical protein SKAU_G00096270 [Synaphobranchus kaupii]